MVDKIWFWPKYEVKEFERWVTIASGFESMKKVFDTGMTYEEIGKKYGVPHSEVARVLNFYGIKSVNRSKGRIRSCSIRKLPAKCSVDSADVGYVLGVLYGDGSITGGNGFSLTVVDRDFIDYVVSRFRKLGYEDKDMKFKHLKSVMMRSPANLKVYKTRPQFRMQIHSMFLADFLCGIKLEDLNDEQKVEFVNGFVDSEAHVTKNGSIHVSNTEKGLLEFVQKVLLENQVDSRIWTKRTGGISAITGRPFKTVYELFIGAQMKSLFHERFRFSIKRKQDKLDKAVESYKKRTHEDDFIRLCRKNRKVLEPIVEKM